MITTLAVHNYRSLLDLVVPLGMLNVVTGENGSGKSNLYRALRLLAETAHGGVVNSLAREGGIESAFWAGPEKITRRMRAGQDPIQGGPRQKRQRVKLGFATEEYSYSIDLGLPQAGQSAFNLDPEIKRECIWAGPVYRPASLLVDRNAALIRIRDGREWQVLTQHSHRNESIFSQAADPRSVPEVFSLREMIRGWRFYDYFRTDHGAPARSPQLGTRTPVLQHDGHDLAAALQTIREVGDAQGLDQAIDDAFPGSQLEIVVTDDTRFSVRFHQQGLLRPLTAAELSDGTLRYLLLMAALMTPRPPSLMVLNEPETSLHPDLLPALARLIVRLTGDTQVWVVSHSQRLIAALEESAVCHSLHLTKHLGQTEIADQGTLDQPPWVWPDKA